MAEEKTETSSKKQKTKSRAFYFIDGILVRLLLIVVLIALLWNWDGFWKTDIKILKQAQKTYFPIKYEDELLKTSVINKNLTIVQQMKDKASKYKQETEKALKETDKALKAVEAAEAEVIAVNEKATVLLRYYDTSRRIIEKLKRKFSPDELDATLKCNSIECENIVKSSPKAAPETYSFQ